MLSRDILKRIGVLGVTMGLAASPFAWSAGSDKEADAYGEKSDTSTMTEGTSGSAGMDAETDTEWEEEEGGEMEPEGTSGTAGSSGSAGMDAESETEWEEKGNGEVSSDPGAPGVEGGEGTQSGEEPDPNDADSTQGAEEDET